MPQPQPFNQHGFVNAGRGWSHGLSRGHAHRGIDGMKGSHYCSRGRHTNGCQNQLGTYPVAQLGESEDICVDAHKPVPQQRPHAQPQNSANHHNHQHQLQVVQTNRAVFIAQRLQCGNLLALGGDHAAEHHIEQKAGYRQKNAGQHCAQHTLLLDLGVENHVRHLFVASMGLVATIRRQQPVQAVNYRALAGLRCQPHGNRIECALHIVGRSQRPPVHPEHAKAALVR